MRVYSLQHTRGGSGRTTLAVHLAAEFARLGHRTLLVDLDPNADMTASLAVPQSATEGTTADVLMSPERSAADAASLVWSIDAQLSIVPASNALIRLDTTATPLASSPTRDQRLSEFLRRLDNKPDVVLIDTPSSFGTLTLNALYAADTVLIPCRVDAHAERSSKRYLALCTAAVQALSPQPMRAPALQVIPQVSGPSDLHDQLAGKFVQEPPAPLLDDPDGTGPFLMPFDPSVDMASVLGEPMLKVRPDSAYVYACKTLAGVLSTRSTHSLETSRLIEAKPASNSQGAARLSISSARPSLDDRSQLGESISEMKPSTSGGAQRDEQTISGRAAELVARVDHVKRTTRLAHASRLADPRVRVEMEQAGATAARPDAARSLFGVRSTSRGLLFVIDAPEAADVCVKGTFSDWSDEPMHFSNVLNAHEALVQASPGMHRYVVSVDGEAVEIPNQESTTCSTHGTCGMVVSAPGVAQRAAAS